MIKWPKSKTGLFFAACYLVWAVILISMVADCSGMFCDWDALPVLVPVGILIAFSVNLLDKIYFFGTSYTSYRLTDLFFTLPAVIGNIISYY